MPHNVLILCTHNSARSVLAEAMLNHLAAQQRQDVRAFSAGAAPSGRVNPLALEVLQAAGVATAGLRSKSWDEFVDPGAPPMRVVITVCDSAAQEVCPVWPGAPVQVHWGYADPSSTLGDTEAKRRAFEATRVAIGSRMEHLLALPMDDLSNDALRAALLAIAAK